MGDCRGSEGRGDLCQLVAKSKKINKRHIYFNAEITRRRQLEALARAAPSIEPSG